MVDKKEWIKITTNNHHYHHRHRPVVDKASGGVKDKSPAATSRVWVDPVLPVCKLEIYHDGNHGHNHDHIMIILLTMIMII